MRASRCVVALSLACSAVQAHAQTGADPAQYVEWSADRKLTVQDFHGRVPARTTEASRSWVAIEVDWECADGAGSYRARAVFDPARSWWREANRNIWQGNEEPSFAAARDNSGRNLLAHEQLHFDLTEAWTRRIRALLATLPTVCKTPGAAPGLEKAVAALEHDWQEEQQRYDRETAHGADAQRQRAWAAKTEKALAAGYAGGAAAAER